MSPPVNAQNDRLYVSATTTKRDVDAVSKLGCSDMLLVEPGDKVNGAY